MSGRGRGGRGGFNKQQNRGGRSVSVTNTDIGGRNKRPTANRFSVQISNIGNTTDVALREYLTLEMNTTGQVVPLRDFHIEHHRGVCSFATSQEAATFTKLVNGLNYKGSILEAKFFDEKQSVSGAPGGGGNSNGNIQQVKEAIAKIITESVDGLTLNLNSLNSRTGGLVDPSNGGHVRMIVEQIKHDCAGLQNLVLDRNGLITLSAWKELSKIPTLVRISLVGNIIDDVSAFDGIKLNLLLLQLADNPIFQKLKNPNVVAALKKQFPAISQIDGGIINRPLNFALPDTVLIPMLPPISPGFSASAEISSPANNFVANYLQYFDLRSVEQLSALYEEVSYFSVSIQGAPLGLPGLSSLQRNLQTTDNQKRLSEGLFHGKVPIISAIKKFPETAHHLESRVLDVVTVGAGSSQLQILVVVYGSVTIHKKDCSYVRRFLLQRNPASPLGVSIVNDQLYLSTYTGRNPALPPVSSAPTTANPLLSPQPDQMNQMVMQVQQATNMKPEYAIECLRENNWSVELAVNNFRQLMAAGTVPAGMLLS